MVELMAAGVDAKSSLDGSQSLRPELPAVYILPYPAQGTPLEDEMRLAREVDRRLSSSQVVVLSGYPHPQVGWSIEDFAGLGGGCTTKGIFTEMEYEWQCTYARH